MPEIKSNALLERIAQIKAQNAITAVRNEISKVETDKNKIEEALRDTIPASAEDAHKELSVRERVRYQMDEILKEYKLLGNIPPGHKYFKLQEKYRNLLR